MKPYNQKDIFWNIWYSSRIIFQDGHHLSMLILILLKIVGINQGTNSNECMNVGIILDLDFEEQIFWQKQVDGPK